ncbi:acetate--CoA ligase family protein [Chloroflexota bacterium]
MELADRLNPVFKPESIAVIGASDKPEKVGYICLSNLVDAGYKGRIYPVNPNISEVLGLKGYPSIGAIPDEIDLAVIVIPAQKTVKAIEECVASGVKAAIIISSGFRELGTTGGQDLQAQLVKAVGNSGMKIVGPNTLGVVNPRINLLASFQSSFRFARAGGVSVASQSGGMCSYIVNALTNHNMGISKAIGMGNRCNLDFDEVVTYLAEDEETRVILLYIEGLEQPQKLMKAAREAVKKKPVLVYKGGREESSDQATLSHTGSLAGEHRFYEAAFTQSGMISVNSLTELVDIAKAVSLQPAVYGNRVAILSAQAGGGIIIADRCRETGLLPAKLSTETKTRLREHISPLNQVDNPVDLAWVGTNFDACINIIKTVMDDDGVDAVIAATVYYAPSMEMMKALIELAKDEIKPVTVCLDSPLGAADAQLKMLEKSGIPAYPMPERAVTGMAGLARWGKIIGDGGVIQRGASQ